uniref:ubiquitinyl hydrolase 1 n=2 Tax=Caenorhabditis japonica TaxID=281687 RepID=A0A8R1HJ44_CAEJA
MEQQDNGKQLARSGWTCEVEKCGLQENLWLNLTDGAIRCGRSQFVSEGVKTPGNGHMQDYYDRTSFPLVVKLGTISADLESVDVYSYDENDAVIDPNIIQHLKHFGLDAFEMVKTAKSTMELEMDMNEKWEWAKCTEDGAVLEPIYGPGYTGLINTGSSCYVNSVLQALIQVDSFRTRYSDRAADIFSTVKIENVPNDFNAQFAKVIRAMLSGDYSNPTDLSLNTIKPLRFKKVAAGRHPEFATAKQQDVEEYIRFLFEKIAQESQGGDADPTESFRFQTWTRFEDIASQKVRYTEQEEILLRLSLPEVPADVRSFGEPTNKMTKLTIEAEPKFDIEDKYCVVIHPNLEQQIYNVQGCQEISEFVFFL